MNTTTPPLQYASVCSGIEAVSLAWQPLGMAPAWFSEIDAFACAVLAHRHPNVHNLGDMTRIETQVRAATVPAADILIGGTPCQSFSTAGARRGLSDPRGALTLHYVQLANAIDHIRHQTHRPPVTLVWENVPGVLSDRRNAFGCLLGALAGESRALEPPGNQWTHAGCVSGPRRRIAWRVLDAQYFGLAQRRRRVFLVASGRDDFDPAAVLFESEGLHGHPAPRCAPWEDAAGAAASGAAPAGDDAGLNCAYSEATIPFGGDNTRGPIHVAACLSAAPGFKSDFDVETFVVQSVAGSISHTLGATNGCVEDGAGRGVPIIAMSPMYSTSVAFAQNSRDELRLESGHGQLCGALSTGGGKPGQGRPMLVSLSLRGRTPQWRARRLMPLECERLQGLPDNYTLVPYRGKPAADAPRYKAIGNSMAVPCIAWIGQRLLRAWA